MKHLAARIVEVIVYEFGQDEVLQRLSSPFWFQAFGCILGFDWHSSGLTTTVCGALKEAVKSHQKEWGIFVTGGKGRSAIKTKEEIISLADKYSFEPAPLVYASRMSAKVDNTALQDGFQLYHHTFIFTNTGNWAVIQQGMNPHTRLARRYHWLSQKLNSFVDEPHSAICSQSRVKPLNMVAHEAQDARSASVELVSKGHEYIITELDKLQAVLNLPETHRLMIKDLHKESLKKILLKTYEQQPRCFEELLSIQGVGPKTIRALALMSELIYGTKLSWRDPAKYSFAHGGKDGQPYPVDRKQYDATIEFLRMAICEAKLGNKDKLDAMKRLDKIKL
jgi:hypothetical protein